MHRLLRNKRPRNCPIHDAEAQSENHFRAWQRASGLRNLLLGLRRIHGEQVQKRRAGRMAAPKGKSDVSAPTAFGPEPKIQMGQQEIN